MTSNRADNAAKKTAETREEMGSTMRSRLSASFKHSDGTKTKTEECHREINKLMFKDYHEDFLCKSLKDISAENFPDFVEKLKNRYQLPDEIKESLLDILEAEECEETLRSFHCNDGKANFCHGRLIAIKKGSKIDVIYAIFTMSFELPEIETDDWVFKLWLSVVPIGWEYKKEAQSLSHEKKTKLSDYCELLLSQGVAQYAQKNKF